MARTKKQPADPYAPQEKEAPPREGRRRRKGRLRPFEMFVMACGYLAILYVIIRALVYVAVLLAR